jgi:hypothetical protein
MAKWLCKQIACEGENELAIGKSFERTFTTDDKSGQAFPQQWSWFHKGSDVMTYAP